MTNIFNIMRQNYSPISWPTLKACYDKRARLHARTYKTLNVLFGHMKHKILLHQKTLKYTQINSWREYIGQ